MGSLVRGGHGTILADVLLVLHSLKAGPLRWSKKDRLKALFVCIELVIPAAKSDSAAAPRRAGVDNKGTSIYYVSNGWSLNYD